MCLNLLVWIYPIELNRDICIINYAMDNWHFANSCTAWLFSFLHFAPLVCVAQPSTRWLESHLSGHFIGRTNRSYSRSWPVYRRSHFVLSLMQQQADYMHSDYYYFSPCLVSFVPILGGALETRSLIFFWVFAYLIVRPVRKTEFHAQPIQPCFLMMPLAITVDGYTTGLLLLAAAVKTPLVAWILLMVVVYP